jgi:hypothetical protein
VYRLIARLGLPALLAVTLGLGAAGCGSGSPGAGPGSAGPAARPAAPAQASRYLREISQYLGRVPAARRVAFTQCMRTHGVPRFPSTLTLYPATVTLRGVRAAGIDVHSPGFRSALRACRSSLAGRHPG